MLTLVILAAGAGSRYGGLKPLAPVGPSGEALLEYSAHDARVAGFSRVVLVVRSRDEALFRQRLDSGLARHLSLTYVHQIVDDLPPGCARRPDRIKPWGTGHAVLAAEDAVTGPFAVLNADDFYGAGSFAAVGEFLRRSEPDTLAAVGFPVEQTLSLAGPVSRAFCQLDEQGLLREIVELEHIWRQDGRIVYRDVGDGANDAAPVAPLPLRGDELVSMNMWGFSSGLFAELRRRFIDFLDKDDLQEAEFRLPDLIQDLIHEGRFRVEVLPGSGPWCGITFRRDVERTAKILSTLVDRGHYPSRLWD